MERKAEIIFENGKYVFSYQDENGFVVTDGESIEELYSRIKEAMDLHCASDKEYSLNLTLPIRLSLTNTCYAFNV